MEEFRCLESTFGDAEARNWLVITEPVNRVHHSDDNSQEIVCWLVASYGNYRQHAIYRLTAEQCGGAARDRIGAGGGHLLPAATLVELRRGGVGWFTDFSRVCWTKRRTSEVGLLVLVLVLVRR